MIFNNVCGVERKKYRATTWVKDQSGSFSRRKFIVVHGKAGNLISYATAVKVGLMQSINAIKCVDEEHSKSHWINKHPAVFS